MSEDGKEQVGPSPKESPKETITSAGVTDGQARLRVDESHMVTVYSSTTRISATAEEVVIDLAQGLRPATGNQAVMKVDARVILSPWAAKRLALALGQTVQRYEQTYGVLELDPRRRARGGAPAGTAPAGSAPAGSAN